MKRRGFLQATGLTGLFFYFQASIPALEAGQLTPGRPAAYPMDMNAYLRIGADERVGCFVGKVELGQGSMTALAQLAAEELDVPLDRVDMLMGDTDLCPWDPATGGSLGMWQFGPVLKGAAAQVRGELLQMAASTLKVPVSDLDVKAGVVSVKGDPTKNVTYGQLAQGKRVERQLRNVKPKPVSAHTLVGQSAPRKDAVAKITGAAQYAGDLRLPGTLHACILRPPAHGLTLKHVDTTAAERMQGVRVVRDGDLVAVLHAQPDQARKALDLVKADFEGAPRPLDSQNIYQHLVEKAPELKVASRKGDLQAGESRAASVVEGEYRNAYVAHATLEPHTAVAKWEKDRMTVWASTQSPFKIRADIAQALKLPAASVRVITPFVGGAFGGKLVGPDAVEVARLARLVPGKPVQLAWSRKEDFFLDTFRPAAVIKVRSGLDATGTLTFWDYQVFGISANEADFAYEFPVSRTLTTGDVPALHPFQTGAWRAPGANTNVFARESHLDRTAVKAGLDPVAFRIRYAADQRVIRLLEAAAERFGWEPAPGPSGRGVGVACGAWRGTLVATMAEVAVDKATGKIQVKRVVEAVDMGLVVNPDGARQQVEGAVTMGLGYALAEEVRFKDGKILDENFDTYQIPQFSWLPKIEVILVDNPGLPAQGCGEPPVVCMGAALANAVFDAIGVRVCDLPMTPERVLEAIKRG